MPTWWPLLDLRLRAGPLELRLPRDDDIPAMIEAARDIHEPDAMPFAVPWSTVASPEFEEGIARFVWRSRADWQPDAWHAAFVVVRDGEVLGVQALEAADFADRHIVSTGSWLNRAHQGQGVGRVMRAAVLSFAFDHLGADAAMSCAFAESHASQAVSRALGYELDGTDQQIVDGRPRDAIHYRLTRPRWASSARVCVEVTGLDACRRFFGVAQSIAQPRDRSTARCHPA